MNDQNMEEKKTRGDFMLPIGVYHGVVESTADGYAHWHKEMEISIIREGEGRSIVSNEISYVGAGDVVLVSKESIHYMKSDSSLSVDTVVFDMDLLANPSYDYTQVNFFNPLFDKKMKMVTCIKHDQPKCQEIVAILDKIMAANEEKYYGYQLEVKGLFYQLFFILFNQNYISKIEEKSAKSIQKQVSIRNVLNYIIENYNKEITTEKLAKIAGYSEYHFIRFFKEQTGRTCKDYVNTIRLEKAAHLLEDSSMSITEIAFEVGYNDLSYFIKVFRNKYNIPPHRYRRTKEKEKNKSN